MKYEGWNDPYWEPIFFITYIPEGQLFEDKTTGYYHTNIEEVKKIFYRLPNAIKITEKSMITGIEKTVFP